MKQKVAFFFLRLVPLCLSFCVFVAAKACGTHLRVHFKHCREIGNAIKGRQLKNAQQYLENVLQFKEAIPITKYTGGIGRHAMGKQYNAPGDKVAWPQKATRTFLDLLRNVESNASSKGLEVEKLVITHVNANQAPKMRRRTYRAHGRINGKCCIFVLRIVLILFSSPYVLSSSLYVIPCSCSTYGRRKTRRCC
jgi:ribosomal protein uL22